MKLTPTFTYVGFYAAQAVFYFFIKFLIVKNQVYQWKMQKIIATIFLTMKATILDTHGILCIKDLDLTFVKKKGNYLGTLLASLE